MAKEYHYSIDLHHGNSYIELQGNSEGVRLDVSSFGGSEIDLNPDEFAHTVAVMLNMLMELYPSKFIPALQDKINLEVDEWNN